MKKILFSVALLLACNALFGQDTYRVRVAQPPHGRVTVTPDCNIPFAKSRKAPQFFVLGTLDRTVGREPMEEYVKHLQAVGQKAELVIVDGASHAFFDWKPDQRTKETFAKYGVPYAAKMKQFFDEVFY